MCEQKINEQYKQFAKQLQNLANKVEKNPQLNSIFSQIKSMYTSMQWVTVLPFSEKAIAYFEEAMASEKLSHEDFLDKYGEEIDICKKVGQAGWVVSEHSNPREIEEWYQLIAQGKTKEIVNYFDADDSQTLKAIRNDLSVHYVEANSRLYYNKGIKSYDKKDYMTAAMYFVALLESRINEYMNYPRGISYSQKYSEKGFEEHLGQEFLKGNSFFTKRFLFLNMYPSLIEYLNRLFVDGIYTFESKNEPPHINRNWLLHGKSTRNIERFECVQILNALSVIEFLYKDV